MGNKTSLGHPWSLSIFKAFLKLGWFGSFRKKETFSCREVYTTLKIDDDWLSCYGKGKRMQAARFTVEVRSGTRKLLNLLIFFFIIFLFNFPPCACVCREAALPPFLVINSFSRVTCRLQFICRNVFRSTPPSVLLFTVKSYEFDIYRCKMIFFYLMLVALYPCYALGIWLIENLHTFTPVFLAREARLRARH